MGVVMKCVWYLVFLGCSFCIGFLFYFSLIKASFIYLVLFAF
jgi:hypothetical protein